MSDTSAEAFWITAAEHGELRPVRLPEPGPGEVLVRTRYSAVSRGTEALVLRGGVPESQRAAMRAPFQEGDFPWPVKYGYLNVGTVEWGPDGLRGRTVFCLYPHQTAYVVAADAVTPIPDAVPAERAVLAGAMETAVNAVWDARPRLGDRIAVIGAGMVGSCVAAVLAAFPGVRLQLVDTDSRRCRTAEALGVPFAAPEDAEAGCDLVFHASATEQGLARALELLAPQGEVLELSWYGDRSVNVPLGASFHPGRLAIRSSQVGTVANPRRSFAERMALAVELLASPKLDALITGQSEFAELPAVLPMLAANPGLCHRIVYPEGA